MEYPLDCKGGLSLLDLDYLLTYRTRKFPRLSHDLVVNPDIVRGRGDRSGILRFTKQAAGLKAIAGPPLNPFLLTLKVGKNQQRAH